MEEPHFRFSEMFAELEMEEERCGIDSFGLSLCSLEEVLQRCAFYMETVNQFYIN